MFEDVWKARYLWDFNFNKTACLLKTRIETHNMSARLTYTIHFILKFR